MPSASESYLYRDIHEQPAIISRLVDKNLETAERLRVVIREQAVRHVVIAARGTSDNAGRYAQYLLGARNRMIVSLATPSLYTVYEAAPSLQGTLVIGISQSGQSPDIIQVVREANNQGALTASICNNPHSALAQTAMYRFDINAGVELSVAATKSYTAQLATIALLSVVLSGDNDALEALNSVPQAMEAALTTDVSAREIAERSQSMRHCAVIGRGYNYATAFELALKLKELTYTVAEAYSSADFMHGPLALVEPGFPLLLIAPSGKLQAEMLSFLQGARRLGARVVAISDVWDILAQADLALQLPVSVPEWLSPLVAVIPGQLLSMHLACLRGIDLDAPRSIAKITRTL